MSKFLIHLAVAALCWAVTPSVVSAQMASDDRHQVSVRYIFPNYIELLDNKPTELEDAEESFYGFGLELEYQRRIAPNFLIGVPIHLRSAEAIDRESLRLNLPFERTRNLKDLVSIGTDLLLVIEPIAKRAVFDPQIWGGFGIFSESFQNTTAEIPLGVNLNIRLGENIYFSPNISYRIALDDDDDKIRNNLQPGIGLHVQFGQGTPPPPPPPIIIDTDADGIADSADRCPTEAGPATTQGCPDQDGDGVPDGDDKCPEVAGTTTFMGCPDTDGDGIADPDDECPDQAGPKDNNGCPLADRDGDGVVDADDACPDVAGTAALNGCPDGDGDGVTDADDRCPDAAGTAANGGCPDTDGDGIVDIDDRCPTEAGPASTRGCPEITQEDIVVLEDATKNINFETAKAVLTADSRVVLDNVVDIMNRYPAYSLAIGGHTDSVGSAESNQALSERRARAVLDYLTSKGISASRMTSTGYGESQPIADNRYAAGREQNRRVMLDLTVK